MTIYSTVPSGFQELAANALLGRNADVNRGRHAEAAAGAPADRIIAVFDGAVLYSTGVSTERISALGFVQNSFLVIRSLPSLRRPRMDTLMKEAIGLRINRRRLPSRLLRKARTFRLVTSEENRLVSPNRRLRDRLEAAVASALGLRPRRGGADLELWLLVRRDGTGVVGFRLSQRRATEKTLPKGSLRPELANLLCRAAPFGRTDRVVDPFCGSGSIVAERVRMYPLGEAYGFDVDPANVKAARRYVTSAARDSGLGTAAPITSASITIEVGDARRLTQLRDGAVDVIITDPPWGHYESHRSDGPVTDVEVLYRRFLAESTRILDGGWLVMLVERDGPMEGLLDERAELRLERRYEVLVQGRKATVLVVAPAGRRT